MGNFIKNRLKEASTWRGIIALLGVFGVVFSPEQADAVVTACVAVYGAVAVFLPDKLGKPSNGTNLKDANKAMGG